MAEFDRNRLLDNVYRLAKQNNIKIGELEQSVGVSTGYLSRLAKDENKGSFSAELLCALADKLGTTMGALVFTDAKGLTDNEKYLMEFLDKLTADTEKYVVEWTMMEPMIEDATYIFDHPMFREVEKDGEDEVGNYHIWKEMQYDSRYLESGTASIAGNCFYTRIDDFSNTDIYIMNVEQGYRGKYASEKNIFEIYFIRGLKVESVACSVLVCEQLKETIIRLYQTIEAARSHLTVEKSVRDVMNRFMTRGVKK